MRKLMIALAAALALVAPTVAPASRPCQKPCHVIGQNHHPTKDTVRQWLRINAK